MNQGLNTVLRHQARGPRFNSSNWLKAIVSPLSRRLIVSVVLFSSLITLCTSGLQIYSTFQNEVNDLDSLAEEIQYSRLTGLVESIWSYDDNLVQIQLEGINRMLNIDSVAILVNDEVKWSAGNLTSGETRDYSFPLVKKHNDKTVDLGELVVKGDMGAIIENIKGAALLVVVSNAFKTLLVTMLFTWMFYYHVGKHLLRITEYNREYTPGEKFEPLVLDRKHNKLKNEVDELSILVDSMNDKIKIIEEFQSIQASNEKTALEQARKLAIANEELEEFTVRTSHDLRAPLVSSLALLDLLKGALKEEDALTAGMCADHACSSLVVLKDLLDSITQLMLTKKSEETPQWVDLAGLINNSLLIVSDLKGFSEVDVSVKQNFSGDVLIKENCLQGVVGNLISNAIKYKNNSANAYLKIEYWIDEDQLVIQVSDNGLGIPQENEKDMFKLFKRFHSKVSFGSGMGMYIMKVCAEKMQATLTFQAADQGGCIFRLSVPSVQCRKGDNKQLGQAA